MMNCYVLLGLLRFRLSHTLMLEMGLCVSGNFVRQFHLCWQRSYYSDLTAFLCSVCPPYILHDIEYSFFSPGVDWDHDHHYQYCFIWCVCKSAANFQSHQSVIYLFPPSTLVMCKVEWIAPLLLQANSASVSVHEYSTTYLLPGVSTSR